ncbi:hypothetical protein GG344DRAFT_76332 [Lentinula edodes]|nr:hypothetical protein GG344DRAFT_76332 [Lentinula edodes]
MLFYSKPSIFYQTPHEAFLDQLAGRFGFGSDSVLMSVTTLEILALRLTLVINSARGLAALADLSSSQQSLVVLLANDYLPITRKSRHGSERMKPPRKDSRSIAISPPKNKEHDKSKRLNLKGSQLKPNSEKFVCGALSKDMVQGKKDRLCVLISGANFLTETNMVYSKEPGEPMPNTVRFYKTQMEMDHTLLTNEQIGFTGLCYTQIETQKSGDLEIPWQDWAIPDWPTDNDHGTRISVGNIERHHKAEASMSAFFYPDDEFE